MQPSQLACETSFFEQSVSGRLVVVKFLLEADLPKALAKASGGDPSRRGA